MFAKVTNATIETYPYNPQVDHPLTAFPVGASYPAFDCYWVHPKPQDNPDPTTLQAVETTPVFNQQAARWEQAWNYELLPEPPPVADWDGFNEQMLSTPEYHQITGVVLQTAPALAIALPAALAQVSTHGITAFALVFNAFCQAGGVTEQQREDWAECAEGFNLPAEFVNVIRG